jgi:hypothetical protein
VVGAVVLLGALLLRCRPATKPSSTPVAIVPDASIGPTARARHRDAAPRPNPPSGGLRLDPRHSNACDPDHEAVASHFE